MDARRLASQYGLHFPTSATLPTSENVRRAQAAALVTGSWPEQLERLVVLGLTLLSGDHVDYDGALNEAELSGNQATLHRSGHCQGAMLKYEVPPDPDLVIPQRLLGVLHLGPQLHELLPGLGPVDQHHLAGQ
ncbi:MAG: hypothetical protein ACI9MC_002023, partial [Kiritimatiellia bacterium]